MSMTVQLHFGADVWVEVRDFRGSFWVKHDTSLVDLVLKMQGGGYSVKVPAANRRPKRSG